MAVVCGIVAIIAAKSLDTTSFIIWILLAFLGKLLAEYGDDWFA